MLENVSRCDWELEDANAVNQVSVSRYYKKEKGDLMVSSCGRR